MPRKTLKKASELDKFRQWIKHLRIKSEKIPVIVRGEREKRRLAGLKIKNIYILKDPYFALAEKLADQYNEAILLFDVTKNGHKVYEKIQREFELVGIKIDNRFRQFIYHTKQKTIQGLITYIEKYLFAGLNPRKTINL
jgi:5S rRNA maturation endonuclease (ribonuclease M5)